MEKNDSASNTRQLVALLALASLAHRRAVVESMLGQSHDTQLCGYRMMAEVNERCQRVVCFDTVNVQRLNEQPAPELFTTDAGYRAMNNFDMSIDVIYSAK
jgi:hypothetical protein